MLEMQASVQRFQSKECVPLGLNSDTAARQGDQLKQLFDDFDGELSSN
jgi:hypothetical protein